MQNKEIYKKIFLEELPKLKLGDNYFINWKKSVGYYVRFLYDDIEGYIKIIDYIPQTQDLIIKYKECDYKIKTYAFKKCYLWKIVNGITKEFKIEVGTKFKDNNKDIVIIDRKYVQSPYAKNTKLKYYKIKCNKCGFDSGKYKNPTEKESKEEYWVIENYLLRDDFLCPCCSNKIIVKGINDIATTNPDMVKYFVNIEDAYTHTYGSGDKVLMKCPNCKTQKLVRISDLYTQRFSCPNCGDGISYPNKFMYNLLEQLGVEFETEYSPDWIKPKRYDFYIPSMNLIIEMDGGFHNKYNSLSGQTKKESKEIDNYKDELAKEHGLKIIRIDCDYKDGAIRFQYIKENTINKLNKIFDFSNIDWLRLEKDNEISFVIIISDILNKNKELNIIDLTKIFKINYSTARKYYHLGVSLGLIRPKEKSKKEKILKPKGKKIEIFKDGISLGIFENSQVLAKQSEELFGVKLNPSHIRNVCLGRRKSHKGFTFKEVKEE